MQQAWSLVRRGADGPPSDRSVVGPRRRAAAGAARAGRERVRVRRERFIFMGSSTSHERGRRGRAASGRGARGVAQRRWRARARGRWAPRVSSLARALPVLRACHAAEGGGDEHASAQGFALATLMLKFSNARPPVALDGL